jgi:aminoglycoside phosphotransferase (APT) family kinase protein
MTIAGLAAHRASQVGHAHIAKPRAPDRGIGLLEGQSHATYLAHDLCTGCAVVVKTGGDLARLAHEAQVLAALAAIPGAPCARLLEASRIPSPGHPPQPRLIVRYIHGRHPRTLADHQAFGAALANLHNIPATGPLQACCQPSAQLLLPARTLAATADSGLADLIDALTPLPGQPWTDPVLIHGDAGPANALIRHRDGHAVLIDFENAALAHPGLDIGRAVFLTDLTRAPARQRRARIDAILTGYACHRTLPGHLSHWTAVAGLQIAAWRHGRRSDARIPSWTIALNRAKCWAEPSEKSSHIPGQLTA